MIVDPRYQRGKIYTIRSHKTPLVYVGSTIEKSLKNRLSGHRTQYKQYKNGTGNYRTSFDILDIDENCYIELYENYPCDSKEQLEKREGQIIRELDCINKCIPGRTKKEWREDNKEKRLEYYKQWKDNNKEYFNEYQKQYHENNKEKRNIQSREHYQNNKEKLNAKYNCECGGRYTHCHRTRHMKSKKHKEYMEFMYN